MGENRSFPFGRLTMISREQAVQIAVEKLRLHDPTFDNLNVRKVVSIDEIMGRRPVTYTVGGIEDCWSVYFEQTNGPTLCSSRIMLISRATGEEVYFGSAGDEG
jgi:hypothetical protein